MIARWLRAFADWLFIPIAKGVARLGISANMVTIIGLVIAAIGCYYIAVSRLFIGALIVTGGMLFDSLDGSVAKVTGKMTKAGAFLDSTLDRVADAFLMLAVAVYFLRPLAVLGPSGSALALTGLVLGFLISYVRARAESLGFECKVGMMERASRAIIVILGVFFEGLGFPTLIPSLVILVILSTETLVHRFVHVWKQARIA